MKAVRHLESHKKELLVKTGVLQTKTKTDDLLKKMLDEPHNLAPPDLFDTVACPEFGMQVAGYTSPSADYKDPLGAQPSGSLDHRCFGGHNLWKCDDV
jgi:hypothetical protein